MKLSYEGDVGIRMYINPLENRKDYIIEQFENSQAFQMPVVKDGYLIGIISLFDVARCPADVVDVYSLLQTDCYVAGKTPSLFSFKIKGQSILPYVDEDGKYLSFINRVTSKCYVPSKEYLRLIEATHLDLATLKNKAIEFTEPFDTVLENNEHCVFMTLKPGCTIAINDEATLLNNIQSLSDFDLLDHVEKLDTTRHIFDILPVRTYQHLQSRKELTMYRVDEQEGNEIVDLRRELADMERLAQLYKTQLSLIHAGDIEGKDYIFSSERSKALYKKITNIAQFDSSVLLLGESGVGKSLFASIIHKNSDRRGFPFIVVDCAALPATLLEAELFGYESGAFTGAKKSGKTGLVELADKGTLFLDEISEVPFDIQGKLLRLIQDKCFYRVGGEKPVYVDIRIVTATNQDLKQMVENKEFRKDLYYRINVVPVVIPSLRERKEDIIPLIDCFLRRLNQKYSLAKALHPSTYRILREYDWPGNIRELENRLEYMYVTSSQKTIYPDSFSYIDSTYSYQEALSLNPNSTFDFRPLKSATEQFEKEYIETALDRCADVKALADILGVDRSTLFRKMNKYQIAANGK